MAGTRGEKRVAGGATCRSAPVGRGSCRPRPPARTYPPGGRALQRGVFTSPLEGEVGRRPGGGYATRAVDVPPPTLTLPLKGGGDKTGRDGRAPGYLPSAFVTS